MITCDDLRPMLAGYVDGQLSALEAEAVAAHLQQCGRCRQIVRDQQQAQYVLDADRPAAVPDERWADIGKRLRTELEGTGDRLVLKTRCRIETLSAPTLPTEEPRPPARPPEPPSPIRSPEPFRAGTIQPSQPERLLRRSRLLRPRAARPAARLRLGKARFAWAAHAIGALAAAIAIAIGLAPLLLQPSTATQAIEPGALARADDVTIMDIQTMDPHYNVVLYAGDAADVAAVWVVPANR